MLWQNVTIQQILNHTSGIPDYLNSPRLTDILRATNSSKQWAYEEIIDLVRDNKPNFRPGNGWNYSQTNYVLAGKIIEVVTQNTLESELSQRILMLLHLKNTLYHPYAYEEEMLQRMAHGYSEYGLFSDEPKDITHYNISWVNAAGSMLSTAHDKAIWLKALVTTDILPPLQKQKLKRLVDPNTGQFLPLSSMEYGYGAGVIRWHNAFVGSFWVTGGMTMAYYTTTFYLEHNDIVVSVAFNHVNKLEHEDGMRLFWFKVLNMIQGFDIKGHPKLKAKNERVTFPFLGDIPSF